METKVGEIYRFCLGNDFYRDGRVLAFDSDDILVVEWLENDQRDYVRRDQLA